ncbi:uncharacterized protein LOC106468285 isoform X2 [Limulus polyphemus]|uniref:Uncharacterized protein LOC106468285 isoform X2 n=1 Tax=Limulus polyphemus TaxID=6850 RepID=A0ABM1T8X2_LIMPO|nr:uncharacterized protein LOC106468285 isoform X2 [Limulus polyphemus]
MSLKPNAVTIQKIPLVEEENPTSGVIHVKFQVLSAEILQEVHHRAKYKFQKWKEEIEWKEYCEEELTLLNNKVFYTSPFTLASSETAHSGDKSSRQATKRNNVNFPVKIKEGRQHNGFKKTPVPVAKSGISKKGFSRTDQSRTVPYLHQEVQNHKEHHDKVLQTICHQIQEVQKDLKLISKEISESRVSRATQNTVISKDLVKKDKVLEWCKMEEECTQAGDGNQRAVLKRAVAHLVAKKAKKSPKSVGFLLPKHLKDRRQLSHRSNLQHSLEQNLRSKKKKNYFHETSENGKTSWESLRLIRDKAVNTSPTGERITKNVQEWEKEDVIENFFTGSGFQKQNSENRNCQRLKNPVQHNWLHDLHKMWAKLESKEMENDICHRWGEVCHGDLPTLQQDPLAQTPEPILISKSSQPPVSTCNNETITLEAKDVKLERQLPGIVFTKPDTRNKTRMCVSSSFDQPHQKGLLYLSSQQLEAIHSYKKEYEHYRRKKSFSLKGVHNSVKLVEETAETLLNELMNDVVEELENLPDTCVSQLYLQEFVSNKTGAHLT